MIKLIDTNTLVDHLRNKSEATNLLIENIEMGIKLCYSVITRIELFSGMKAGEKKDIENLLMSLQSVPVTVDIAQMAGEYMNLYRKSHALTIPDAIIAASAKYKNATLFTLNTKHFPMKDIDIVKPY
ncbi:MAG TPA: type II toxin-antitoxin system VapC family toxin [Thermoanaerobacterales bacterium]|nr:type II toxin-antitoxin system VapC family toxin [Thermoanaerobacterales bacterium]